MQFCFFPYAFYCQSVRMLPSSIGYDGISMSQADNSDPFNRYQHAEGPNLACPTWGVIGLASHISACSWAMSTWEVCVLGHCLRDADPVVNL